jgi:hypothetical protein
MTRFPVAFLQGSDVFANIMWDIEEMLMKDYAFSVPYFEFKTSA